MNEEDIKALEAYAEELESEEKPKRKRAKKSNIQVKEIVTPDIEDFGELDEKTEEKEASTVEEAVTILRKLSRKEYIQVLRIARIYRKADNLLYKD